MIKYSRREVVNIIILSLVAFFVRILTYNSIFVGNNVRFLEFDPFYHMRRAVSFAEHFPNIWNFDTYLDYPYGGIVGWPPLYDWTIGLISNILGLGHPDKHLIESVGVFFPAILGSLSVVVIYFVCKELFDNYRYNQYIGIVSGFLLAIIPGFVQISFLGFTDHHVAEVLLSLTMFLFILKGLEKDEKDEKAKRQRLIFISIAIFVLIVAIFTWPGTPIFIGIILIFIIIQFIIEKRYKNLFIMIGFLLISFLGLYLLFPNTYSFLINGIDFLTRENPVLRQVVEAQPLFFTFQGIFTIEPSWFAFNTALYISILGLILILKYRLNSLKNRKTIFFLVWTFIVMVLNLYQTRFVYLFAVNIVILCSYVIIFLIMYGKDKGEDKSYEKSKNLDDIRYKKADIKRKEKKKLGDFQSYGRIHKPGSYSRIIGAALLIIIIIPSIQTVNTMVNHPLMLSNDWFISLEWLKNNTPNPGNWDYPIKGNIPDYGIMEWWDYGNYILYLSQRPVVANNFQLGIEDSSEFFASENVTDANNILNKRHIRYVIVDYRLGINPYISGNKVLFLRGAWISLALILNKDLAYYLDENNFPNDKYMNTMYSRLYLFNGNGLKNYKLIYKSPTKYVDIFGKPIEEIKIFEYREI